MSWMLISQLYVVNYNFFKIHKSIPNKEKKLKTHLETFNKEILIKKGQKFQRDKNAWSACDQFQSSVKSSTNVSFAPSQELFQHKNGQNASIMAILHKAKKRKNQAQTHQTKLCHKPNAKVWHFSTEDTFRN